VTEGKSKNTALDWEIIHGLMEDAIYGGRIDNAFDVRVLRAYLRYSSLHLFCFFLCLVNHFYVFQQCILLRSISFG
jgi:hypothetical protein